MTNSWKGVLEGSWTGLNANWTTNTTYPNCVGWTSDSTAEYASEGNNGQVDGRAIFNSYNYCGFSSPIICVEQ